jgi:mannosyltransferase OCH1-like enzyme
MPIPKILFTYWEGNNLSILHYYTISSILKHNPDVDVVIYTSNVDSNVLVQWDSGEHKNKFSKVIKLDSLVNADPDRVKLKSIDFLNEYGINNDLSCVFKADFVRISKLYEHGGAWFDMDVLFIKPFPEIFFQSNVDFYYFSYATSPVVPTGLLLSSPKNELLKSIYETARETIKNPEKLDDYQKIGPILWTGYINMKYENCKIESLPESYVYPYDWVTYVNFFNDPNTSFIKENTFCIHWYNGGEHSKNYVNNFDEYNININRSVCDKLLAELDPPFFRCYVNKL